MSWEKVGFAAVDSGTIMIGDPCYHLHKDVSTPEAKATFEGDFGKNWEEFCDLCDHGHKPGISQFGGDTALVVTGFGGDGCFPVYVKRDKHGLITAAMIDFDDTTGVENDD